MDIVFHSLEELYLRLKPALKVKQSEMLRLGYNNIKIEDIFNYLRINKWRGANDLSLYSLVNDILNVDSDLIDKYVTLKLEKTKEE